MAMILVEGTDRKSLKSLGPTERR